MSAIVAMILVQVLFQEVEESSRRDGAKDHNMRNLID
jgi:hypothetical protein